MCRLLAFASVTDTTIQSLLTPDEFENYRQLSTLHGDGWGAAWWSATSGIHQLNSVRRAVDDEAFLDATRHEVVAAGIVHLRWATSGLAVCIENTHPFASPHWRFAHNGAIPGPERLLEHLSPERRAALAGTTDSEIYFQLILHQAEVHGDIVRGLQEAVRLIRSTCGLGSLNCLLLSEGRMLAVQAFDETPAPVASLADSVGGADKLPEGHDENYYRLRYRVNEGSVVVASTGLGVDGWRALGDDAIIDVDVAAGRARILRLADAEVERTIDLRSAAVA